MGIVRKILGDEKLTKTELINIKDNETEESRDLAFGTQDSTEIKGKTKNLTTADLIPKGIEMFVRLDDYKSIVNQLKRMDTVIEKLEELEKSHSEIQEINDKFVEQLEFTLSEMEDVKEGLGENLKIQQNKF